MFDLADWPIAPEWVHGAYGTSATRNAMSAASLAFAAGGVAFRVPKGMAIAEPLTLDFTGQGHVRALLVLEEGASLTLLETHAGHAGASAMSASRSCSAPSAQLGRMCASRPMRADAVLVEEVAMSVAQRRALSRAFRQFRRQALAHGTGHRAGRRRAPRRICPASACWAASAMPMSPPMSSTRQATPTAAQLFKNVAGGQARAVYQGKITVREGADGSDSRQTAKALLLGERAEADLKPELEIFADDVKCAHGAAVGDLDADSLFYLRVARHSGSRGARHC